MHQTVKSHMSMQLKLIKGFSCQPTVLNLSKLDQLMETTKKLKKIRHLYARKVIKVFSPRSKDEQFVFTERTCFPGLEMVCLKNRNCLMWLFVHWQTLKATTVHPGGGLPTVEDNAAVKIGFKWQNSTKKKTDSMTSVEIDIFTIFCFIRFEGNVWRNISPPKILSVKNGK